MNSFEEKLKIAIRENQKFALFRKPNEEILHLFVQDNSKKNRFLFHSFDSAIEKVISDENPSKISIKDFNFNFELELQIAPNFEPIQQKKYQELIQKTIESIQSQTIRKVVLSRLKVVKNSDFNLLNSYRNLLNQHPSALVFLWHNPNQETWMSNTRIAFKSRKKVG